MTSPEEEPKYPEEWAEVLRRVIRMTCGRWVTRVTRVTRVTCMGNEVTRDNVPTRGPHDRCPKEKSAGKEWSVSASERDTPKITQELSVKQF